MRFYNFDLKKDLVITLNSTIIEAIGDIKLSRHMKNNPSSLEVKFRKEDIKDIKLGNSITLKYKGVGAFKGYIFNIKESEDDLISITAYDQLRYLKNTHTMTVKNKTCSDLIKEICGVFKLKLGNVEDTKIDIATEQKLIENQTLFEIIYNAIDDTMLAESKNGRILSYVLYDDFGAITLKDITTMESNVLINKDNIIKYNYDSSIDKDTYNKIFLYYKDDENHKVNKFIVEDSKTQEEWGVLQKTIDTQRITEDKASDYGEKLLKYYNLPKKEFNLSTISTDINLKGGMKIPVIFNTNNQEIKNFYVVDKVVHHFKNNEYTMDLTLLGVDS